MSFKHSVFYPGTFDPITLGHLNIIERASKIFSKVIIGVIEKPLKSNFLFTLEERIEMIQETVKSIKNIEIQSFNGLLVNHLQQQNINLVVRGLRAISDFEYEFQLALMNKKLTNNIETIFLMTDEKYSYLSSSLIKEISMFGGEVDKFVSKFVVKKLNEKFKK